MRAAGGSVNWQTEVVHLGLLLTQREGLASSKKAPFTPRPMPPQTSAHCVGNRARARF